MSAQPGSVRRKTISGKSYSFRQHAGKHWRAHGFLDNTVELFDRSEDPEETVNVAEENPEIVKDLLVRLTDEMNVVILDDEALEELRALGYVN